MNNDTYVIGDRVEVKDIGTGIIKDTKTEKDYQIIKIELEDPDDEYELIQIIDYTDNKNDNIKLIENNMCPSCFNAKIKRSDYICEDCKNYSNFRPLYTLQIGDIIKNQDDIIAKVLFFYKNRIYIAYIDQNSIDIQDYNIPNLKFDIWKYCDIKSILPFGNTKDKILPIMRKLYKDFLKDIEDSEEMKREITEKYNESINKSNQQTVSVD